MASETLLLKNHINFKVHLFRFSIFLLLLFWCFGFTFTSLYHNSDYAIVFEPLLKKIYSGVCHQNSEKAIAIFGSNLLVCARCTGIYLGALVSLFVLIFASNDLLLNKKLFYISALPILLDVIFYSIGIYSYSKVIAFTTGFFFGSIIIVYIFEALEKIFLKENIIK